MIDYTPPSVPVAPVTISCINQAASAYKIPPIILAGVLAQEGGTVGKAKLNKNNTHDHGPMQINTVKLDKYKKHGISQQMLTNNGCVNVFVGAAILKEHADNANGDLWEAVGDYHSKTPQHHDSYLRKVTKKIQQILTKKITISSILSKANGT